MEKSRRTLREKAKISIHDAIQEDCCWQFGVCANKVWCPALIIQLPVLQDGDDILTLDDFPICRCCKQRIRDLNKAWMVSVNSESELWDTLRISDEWWVMAAGRWEIQRRILIGLALREAVMPKQPHKHTMIKDVVPGPVCDIKSERIYNGDHSDRFEDAVKLLEGGC